MQRQAEPWICSIGCSLPCCGPEYLLQNIYFKWLHPADDSGPGGTAQAVSGEIVQAQASKNPHSSVSGKEQSRLKVNLKIV